MSAFPSSPQVPPQPPTGGPVPPAPSHVPTPPSWRKWAILAAILVVISGAAWALRPKPAGGNADAVASVRTAKVVSGGVQRTLRLTGSTSARNFANLVAPMLRGPEGGRALVLIQRAKSGTMVKKGEVIAQIDGQSIKDHMDDVQATIVASEADLRKRKAEHAIEMETQQQAVRVAKATLDKSRLDLGASEIRTAIDQEVLKLSAEQAEATYKQVLRDVETIKQRQKSEMRLLEIANEKNIRHLDRHKTDITRFTMIAPISGLIVMQSIFRGGDMGQIQLGDQISPGQPFAKIVDISSMQLDAGVNQSESENIRLGQPATISFDAFPGLVLKGKVIAVGALAIGGWRANYYIRSVPVRVAILGSDPRVIPDLSAAADVLLSESDGNVVLPREALQQADGKTVVYVKQAGAFAPREVQLGETSNTKVIVTSGLAPGDEVALQPPSVLNR